MSTLAQKETQEQINGLVLAFREEIMAELQMASDFMSQLQARVETLSKSFKKKQEEDREQEVFLDTDVRTKMKQLFEKHEELSSKLENLLGQKDSLGEHDEGGEDDLRQQYGIYPGHTHFVPVDKFCLQYLPDGHRDKGLNDMMKALADLTVSTETHKMRPYLQMTFILSKLQNLESVKEMSQKIIVGIDLIKTKGESLIQGDETSTYEEITQFVTDKSAEILQCCMAMSGAYYFQKPDLIVTNFQIERDLLKLLMNFEILQQIEEQILSAST
nr:reticulocyte-binding protein 2-like protein a-like isoform X3 [Biomphalaria glabrata]